MGTDPLNQRPRGYPCIPGGLSAGFPKLIEIAGRRRRFCRNLRVFSRRPRTRNHFAPTWCATTAPDVILASWCGKEEKRVVPDRIRQRARAGERDSGGGATARIVEIKVAADPAAGAGRALTERAGCDRRGVFVWPGPRLNSRSSLARSEATESNPFYVLRRGDGLLSRSPVIGAARFSARTRWLRRMTWPGHIVSATPSPPPHHSAMNRRGRLGRFSQRGSSSTYSLKPCIGRPAGAEAQARECCSSARRTVVSSAAVEMKKARVRHTAAA